MTTATDDLKTPPRWFAAAILCACLALSFALFANTFGNAWTYDDYPVLVDNPDIRSLAEFVKDSHPGRPLRELTFLVDHALFGLEPAGYHIQSIFWHGLAGFLIVLLMVRTGLGWVAGGCAGLLFIVHPITVEAVANISHRKESLALVFALLALLAYLRACASEGRRRLVLLLLSLAAGGVACLGKQTAAGLPLLMLACEWTFVERSRWLLLRWWKAWLGLGGAGACAGLAWFFMADKWPAYQKGMFGLLQFKANYFDTIDLAVYGRLLLKAWAFSFGKLLLPIDLAAEYTFPVPRSWFDPWVLAGLLLVAGCLGLMVWLGRRRSPVFPWLVMAVVFYLPVTNLWPLAYLAADRYLYVPCAALAMTVGWLLTRTASRPALALILAVLLALPLATLTWRQNRVWASRESLWQHAYQVNPDSSFVLNNVGNLALLQGDLTAAAGYYQRALETNPLNPTAWYNLGLIFERRGNLRLALKFYQQFINLNQPGWQREIATLQQNLARVYGLQLERGKFDPRLPQP